MALAHLTAAIVIIFYMLGVWLLSLPLRNASIVDVAWGPGFAIVAAVSYANMATPGPAAFVLFLLVTLWAIRLAVHLGIRQWREGEEDARYRAMRANHPNNFAFWSVYMVFGIQALAMFVISLPLHDLPTGTAFTGTGVILAVSVAVFGLLFEAMADFQLAQFKTAPRNKGKLMDKGLWAWSRHPNYFGEAVFWWGIWAVYLAAGGAVWTMISPLAITFLLLRVSGVPILEGGLKKTRPGYDAYIARTSSFIPLPPKRLPPQAD